MKKGFTLIELLAVIVILAVVALIITPVISNVIESARLASLRSGAYGILSASKIYYAKNEIKSTVRFDFDNSVVTSNDTEELIELKGDVKDGALLIDGSGKTTLCITDGKSSAYKNYTDDVVLVSNEACYVPSDRTVVFLSNTGATRTELTNQELTDLVSELQNKMISLETELNTTKQELQDAINTKANQTDVETVATIASSATLDKIYPVGSIYMSTTEDTAAKVAERFGGTWEKIENRFLLGAGSSYAAGTTGGAASVSYTPAGTNTGGAVGNHTLTIAETPSHTHTRGTMNITASAGSFGHTGGISYGINLDGSGMTGAFYSFASTNTYVYTGTGTLYTSAQHHSGFGFDASRSWTGETSSVGGNGAHNHPFTNPTFNGTTATINTMPPYQTVYMYKRVG